MPSPQQLAWLQTAAVSAFACEKLVGVPCELSLVQAITESAWGTKAQGNNLFGLKATPTSYGRQLWATSEWLDDAQLKQFLAGDPARTAVAVTDANGQPITSGARVRYRCQDWFATFATLRDCFVYHAILLTQGRYAAAFKVFTEGGDLETFVRVIAKTYATSPTYSDTLLQLIAEPAVQQAIAAARSGTQTG